MKLDIQIYKPEEQEKPEIIEWNNSALEEAINAEVARKEDLIYTEEEISGAKVDRADLNKLKISLKDKKTEMRKKSLEPLKVFENECNRLIALVDPAIQNIDIQMKSFEDTRKIEKKNILRVFFDLHIGELADLITFKRIFQEQWLNKSFSCKKIEKEILRIIEFINVDLRALEGSVMLDDVEDIKIKYLESLDLPTALRYYNEKQDIRRKIEVQRVARELEKKMADEVLRSSEAERQNKLSSIQEIPLHDTSTVNSHAIDLKKPVLTPEILIDPATQEGDRTVQHNWFIEKDKKPQLIKEITVTLKLTMREDFKDSFKKYLSENNITFTVIKK